MEDLKQYLKIDNNNLFRALSNIDRLGKLSFISSEFDYWKDLFTYNEKRSNLENFLLFRTASEFGLYRIGLDDPDSTPTALNYLKNKLKEIKIVENVEIGTEIDRNEKYRAFKVTLKGGREIYLESDTANSLMGDLGSFLRFVIKEHIEIPKGENWAEATYMKRYGVKIANKAFRNYYWFTLISELPNFLENENDMECFNALEKRAGLIHTLRNIILVPYGYNVPRGYSLKTYKSNEKINDRFDLTIKDFNEMMEDDKFTDRMFHKRHKEFNSEKTSKESVKFLLDNKDKLFPDIPNYPKNENTMEWILKVSNELNRTLEI